MADHIEVVSQAPGFGSKLGDSIKGIFFGLIMFVLAFPILWWGENRQNLAEFVEKGQAIVSSATPTVAAGTLVKTTGVLTSDEVAIDEAYLMPDAQHPNLHLDRTVEMYAWKEDKNTRKEGDKEITTYDYKKDWVSSPEDSGSFKEPSGHQNPAMSVQSASFQVATGKVGTLDFSADATEFYETKDLSITEEMVNEQSKAIAKVSQGKIFIPFGADSGQPAEATYPGVDTAPAAHDPSKSPQVGDVRISYAYFPAGVNGAVVGDWDGSKIAPHVYNKTDQFLGAYAGSLTDFQGYLQSQHNMMTWIIRLVTFFMMWIGLNMLLGPILLVMDSIPILGQVGKGIISLVTGAIAFVLWLLTLVLANLWLILLVLAILVGGLLYYRKKHAAAQPLAA